MIIGAESTVPAQTEPMPLQVVFWEITKACDLACPHCRAVAKRYRDPQELSIDECRHVIDQLSSMGGPILVFSGGDPLKRDDLFDLVSYARQQGLQVGVTPSASPLLTPRVLDRLRDLGVSPVVLSLDAPDADTHDSFRRSPGTFARTLASIRYQRSLGVTSWVNTALLPHNRRRLSEMATLLVELEVQAWNLLAVIPIGRGRKVDLLVAREYEELFNRLYDLSSSVPFSIHVSYAPHYRRIIYQRLAQERALDTPRARKLLAPAPMAADGSLFIDHQGNVCPSGVFPVSGGNVRRRSLFDIYFHASHFQELRDPVRLKGKCGRCEFLPLCRGGSRARAHAVTGDYLEADPACPYEPGGWGFGPT